MESSRLASARGVFKRSGDFDVRPALRALGEALLDAPVALCSTALVRLLSDPTLPHLSADAALAMIASEEDLAPVQFGRARGDARARRVQTHHATRRDVRVRRRRVDGARLV